MDAARIPAAAGPTVALPTTKSCSGNAGHKVELESSPSPASAASAPCQPSESQLGGVANCYVFKSRLQEYAQKVGILTPVYETVKEGPSHEPVFKSTVIVNNVRYDSLAGFFNRKAAEQSAAEIALMEIHKSGQMTESIPTIHETGLCKNMLQEYAQKMNYAIPSYVCSRQPSGLNPFTCTVEIGGIQYIGAAARTKKEAEIKAARTALLAIQRASDMNSNGASQYMVVPGKKKATEAQPEAIKQLKPKKASFKRRWSKKRFPRNKDDRAVKLIKDEPGTDLDNDALRVPSKDMEADRDSRGQQQLEGLIRYQNGQGYGKTDDEPGTLAKDYKMSVMETDGYGQDGRQEVSGFTGQGYFIMDGLAILKLEGL